ncbi:ABC transporter ATP-binding protein [Oceanispirochaeta sp.]|jgi:ABC-type Fe3+/spermidine/putrescine transport system ATPase subunit|uniref:ABC transporter ATP-binding protein n=1 Tax=Oceanispirochaeta sp. TaxID=2035350 RepID=UPI00261ADA8C|nr:ABC transporter ATP-binding protein [Oceanispirochaeta sp.]MDA3955469.1 ABC transporter ATP-binding protein [Oceanispirochaeta sp.]
MIDITLNNLTKQYGRKEPAVVKSLNMKVSRGELVALLGPSGCGKTSILKMIAGLHPITEGEVLFDGRIANQVPAEEREVVMVFQNSLLFPYMSVAQNIAFGLKMRRIDRNEIDSRVNEMLRLVQMEGMGDRKPSQLSGGQKQRVALARALVIRPQVLLLDEPLSNLDAHLRDEMRELILQVHRDFNVTTIFVTHDQEEAVLLADRVALLFEGRLHQFGPVRDFYEKPVSERVASFFGNRNFIKGFCSNQGIDTEVGTLQTPLSRDRQGESVCLMIRPEHILPEKGSENSVLCLIKHKIYMGTFIRYRIEFGGILWDVLDSSESREGYDEGEKVWFSFPSQRIWIV